MKSPSVVLVPSLFAASSYATNVYSDAQKDTPTTPGCTSLKYLFPDISFGPTRTVYTSTSTTTQYRNCGECTSIHTSFLPLGVPPVVRFNATVTATQPSYVSEFRCYETDTGLYRRDLPTQTPEPARTIVPPGGVTPDCVSQTYLDPTVPDSTSTLYPSTVTSTSEIDCGGCAVEWQTAVINLFAPLNITTTTTVTTPSTKVELACSKCE